MYYKTLTENFKVNYCYDYQNIAKIFIMCFNIAERFSVMINSVNSNVNFGAKFDADATNKLLNQVKNDPRMSVCVQNWLDAMHNWGDKNSVISLRKEILTGKDQFVLRNEKLGGDKELGLSRAISDKESSILIAFLDITKKAIMNAEKLLISD